MDVAMGEMMKELNQNPLFFLRVCLKGLYG